MGWIKSKMPGNFLNHKQNFEAILSKISLEVKLAISQHESGNKQPHWLKGQHVRFKELDQHFSTAFKR